MEDVRPSPQSAVYVTVAARTGAGHIQHLGEYRIVSAAGHRPGTSPPETLPAAIRCFPAFIPLPVQSPATLPILDRRGAAWSPSLSRSPFHLALCAFNEARVSEINDITVPMVPSRYSLVSENSWIICALSRLSLSSR
jgi:hypothetical protein